MTQFEFISVAVSIVLALSLARLLRAIPQILAPDRRYWVHAVWAAVMLQIHLGFWWAFWDYREVDDWSIRAFAAVMLTPALLFLTVNALISENPTTVDSWKTHFFAQRRTFFALYLLTLLSGFFRQFAVLGDAVAIPAGGSGQLLWMAPIILVLAGVGISAKTERIHGPIALVHAAFFLWVFSRL